jgi:thymidine phosphorylase
LLDAGSALDVFRRMVVAQGGDPRFIDDPDALPQPTYCCEVYAPVSGYIHDVDAREIGKIVLQLGGGRTSVSDTIDFSAGVDRMVQHGEYVEKGGVLMRLCAHDSARLDAVRLSAQAAVRIEEAKPEQSPLVLTSEAFA